MFERILVPLDGSPRAELILSQVGRILRREDSEILLLRVVDIPQAVGRIDLQYLQQKDREEAQQYLHDVARRFSATGAKVHVRVTDGYTPDVILSTAHKEGSTMIAMSTHGRSGFLRWTLGSVAERIARAADVPLLLVRSFRRSAQGDLEPQIPEELPFKRLLVAMDGSPTAMSVVTPAQKFAQLYGSEVLVAHIRPPFVSPGPMLPGMEAGLPLVQPPPLPASEDDATAKAALRFEQAGLKTRRLTVEGEPASEILALSESEHTDLIALATHGRTGFTRWALGSVAERILRTAEVPLLLVRGPKPKA
jgi:nucleotide-binding universal stress UspA family protein